MLSCLLLVCVGLAGDGWSYSSVESKPGVSKPATRAGSPVVPTAFVGRSVEKLVEHTPAVQAPSPAPPRQQQPRPVAEVPPTAEIEQPAAETVAKDDPPVPKALCGPFGPKPPATKAKCRRCGTMCGCLDACFCDFKESQRPAPARRWYVLPEDSTMEGYGYVDADLVLHYFSLRPRQSTIKTETRAVIRYDTPLPTTNFYPVYTQTPTILSGGCSGGSCGRPIRGRAR